MYPTLSRIVRFLISGFFATGINIAVLYVLVSFAQMWYLPASIIAFLAGFAASFSLQKFWTFRDRSLDIAGQQALVYFLIVAVNLAINTVLVFVFVEWVQLSPILSQVAASAIIAVESYFAYKFFVFYAPPERSLMTLQPTEAANGIALSVVILCYKAGEAAREIVREMRALLEERGLSYELILVANYNNKDIDTDETPRVVRSLAQAEAHIVAVARQKEGMFGWDVRSGLDIARGEHIAFIDGDGQNPLIDVLRIYDALKREHADMAQTYRVKRHDGLERILISRIYNALLRSLFPKVTIYDANSKPKMFTRAAYGQLVLTSDNWFIDAEMVVQACYKGFVIAQVPTVFRKLEGRASFVRLSALYEFIRDLIAYRLDPRAAWRV